MRGIPCGLCVVGTPLSLGPWLWSFRHRLLLLRALDHRYELPPQKPPHVCARLSSPEVHYADIGGSPWRPFRHLYQQCVEGKSVSCRPGFNSALMMENFCEVTSKTLISLKAFSVTDLLPAPRLCKSRRRRNPSDMFPLKLIEKYGYFNTW